jgi:RimJ/RimL family protein N-acetyltransferase
VKFSLSSYLNRIKKKDFNFLIQSNDGKRIGTISIYKVDWGSKSAELGRWICSGSAPANLESLLLGFQFAFEELNLELVYCRTLMSNTRVVNLHKRLPYSERTILKSAREEYIQDTLQLGGWEEFSTYLQTRIKTIC